MSRPSPFPPSNTTAGQGTVHLALLPPGIPVFKTLSYTYPLKLISSTPHKLTPQQATSSTIEEYAPVPAATDSSSSSKNDNRNSASKNAPSHEPQPESHTQTPPRECPLLFLLTYGGGLLSNDHISLSLTLEPGTRLCLTTQGMGKIFKPKAPTSSFPSTTTTTTTNSPSRSSSSSQSLDAHIHTNASLWLAPDPSQPFAHSTYTQQQTFTVSSGASIGLVDWVVSGRAARGEEWDFTSWRGRNEIWKVEEDESGAGGAGAGGRRSLIVRDALVLEQPGLKMRMQGVGVVGTILLYGPQFRALRGFFVEEFAALPRIGGRDWGDDDKHDDGGAAAAACDGGHDTKNQKNRHMWRKRRHEKERRDGISWTACHVRGGRCTVVKLMAPAYEEARAWLRAMLEREGGIRREFGEGGAMFVR